MHYGPLSLLLSLPSPVSAAVCSAGHHGGWGGTHHLPRYGLPEDWHAPGLRGMAFIKAVLCRSY